MLVAEGTGRKLNPDANMWVLARPLIEAWRTENMGPEALLRETADGMAATFQRLPQLIEGVEQSAAMLAAGKVKLDEATLRELRRPRPLNPLPVLAVGAFLFAIVLMLLF